MPPDPSDPSISPSRPRRLTGRLADRAGARLAALVGIDELRRRLDEQDEQLRTLAAAHHDTRLLADQAAAGGRAVPADGATEAAWRAEAEVILARHDAQTLADVQALQDRYREPVFGEARVYDLIERLAQCVDPTDCRLFGASQLTHVLQVLEAMEVDGVLTDELALVALVHDLGKLLLLTDEDPANVVCMNRPIGDAADGVGLDHVVFQWNHDELAFTRLAPHLSDDLAWLVRYHSIDPVAHRRFMDAEDRRRADELLEVFFHYDHGSKRALHRPTVRLADYRDLVEAAFPDPIAF